MKAYKLTQYGEKGGWLIIDNLRDIADTIGGIEYEEVGSKYILEIIKITKEEYDNLPEWDGF